MWKGKYCVTTHEVSEPLYIGHQLVCWRVIIDNTHSIDSLLFHIYADIYTDDFHHTQQWKALSGPLTPQMSPCRERPQTAPWVRAAPSSWPKVWNWQGRTQAFMAECARSHVQTTTLLKVMEVCQQLVPVSRHSGDSRPKVITCTYMFLTHLELCSV